ncbi:AIG2-like family-domain-containing protein [Pseudomassariella vexata]|uniref:Putative gamma-glutamylcyclotransferase n=1 Tax=Pseudomassariella vexata TaxID=1141098 RepID=A0A1Y2EI96_9PEZI|nr:AIG2-like family-domain-containing protein [Pseudomassariella vexata]ORY71283.1 AIG2-like family-domain-containing protein [Pseudomassariella vexata]
MSSQSPSETGDSNRHTAFFYGTLMAPEVFFTVCYRSSTTDVKTLKSLHEFKPAILHGYCRRRVKDADYPGIVKEDNHQVRGMYVNGLTDANMFHLDAFEGSEYERVTVKVRLLEKVGDDKEEGNVEGDEVDCSVYVFVCPNELEDREWDFEEFRTQKMKRWTREDYGFEDAEHFSTKQVDEGEKEAAV